MPGSDNNKNRGAHGDSSSMLGRLRPSSENPPALAVGSVNSTTKQKVLDQRNKQSICWDCANCYGDCSWSEKFIPVDGWEAEQRNISGHNKGEYDKEAIVSYRVDKCPLFVQDMRAK